ncbi:MAG: IS200/IS605 family transposase [Deltaproteobacteria bacterium]|nr:IS200/IS605 family transposase [Deltaproteobacteria bacterium]
MEYQTNSHCKYLIALHLILVVKYRKQLLLGDIGEFVKQSVLNSSESSDFSVEEIEIDKDHIHILMKISPRYSIGQHVRRIKQQTNKLIWGQHPKLKKKFWAENTFWSDGYFVCSVGNASADTIRKYIQEQG